MRVQTNLDIHQRRVEAAEYSAGLATSEVHSIVEQVIQSHRLGGRMLDYGAGLGALTRRLIALQCFDEVAAADIMAVPPDLATTVDWIEQDLNVPLPNDGNAFDVVVAAEVIEHLALSGTRHTWTGNRRRCICRV